MVQYWELVCQQNKEKLTAHAFGSGVKYTEQYGSRLFGMGIQLLCTESSSMGKGGGDLTAGDPFEEKVQALLEPIMGRWKNCNIMWIGDYCDDEQLEKHSESCKNISNSVAAAVFSTLIHLDRTIEIPVCAPYVPEILAEYNILTTEQVEEIKVRQQGEIEKDERILQLTLLLKSKEETINMFQNGVEHSKKRKIGQAFVTPLVHTGGPIEKDDGLGPEKRGPGRGRSGMLFHSHYGWVQI